MHSSILVELKKIVFLSFVLVLLSTLIVGTQLVIMVGGSTTHHVYPGDSIQVAVNSAYPGDTIFVHSGTYHEEVTIDKNDLVLLGEDKATIIDGEGMITPVFWITANNVTVKGFTIRDGGRIYGLFGGGIYITGSNCTVVDNVIANTQYGVNLNGSIRTNIISNNITTNDIGIRVRYSSDNKIFQNNLTDNGGCGIYLDTSNNNSISGNAVVNHTFSGIQLNDSFGNHILGNTVKIGHYCSVLLMHSSTNTVSGNKITHNTGGIVLNGSSNNKISGNELRDNSEGFGLGFSSNNTISRNTMTNNGNGVMISFSSNNTIAENNITANILDGIYLCGTSNNSIISNNILANNRTGISVFSSSNNTISKNNIVGNLGGIDVFESPDNIIFNNNFINNSIQKQVHISKCIWDKGYPIGGNYWSDYAGKDVYTGLFQNETGSDGIGDTAYDQDNYPLMGMFSDFTVALEEQTYHIATICNSTISGFQFGDNLTTIINGMPGTWLINVIVFNVSGEDGTLGFCRICIPMALMNEPYGVFVNGTWVSHTLLPCSNSTHHYLYFTYNHSTQEVVIIPEFPTWTSMILVLIVITVTIVIYKRRLLKTPIQ